MKLSELSRPERAVAVAKDVLKQIRLGKLAVLQGNGYFKALIPDGVEVKEGQEIQEVLKNENLSCEVCALGAAMVSKTLLFNNTRISGRGINREIELHEGSYYDANQAYLSGDRPEKDLAGIFTPQQMDMIEAAFEGDCYFDSIPDSTAEKIEAFHDSQLDAPDMLAKIMKNIVKNKGIFKP